MHSLVFTDGNIQEHQPVVVGLRYAEWFFQRVAEVREFLQRDVLSGLLVEALPDLVVHVEVVLREALLHVLRGLAEVLQDHRDVHVDDDEEADDEVRHEVEDAEWRVATVAVGRCLSRVGVAGRRPVVHEPGQRAVPPRRGGDLEQDDHTAPERLEVEHVVDALVVLGVHEERHAEDGVNEHDEEEKQAYVEESWD